MGGVNVNVSRVTIARRVLDKTTEMVTVWHGTSASVSPTVPINNYDLIREIIERYTPGH